MNLILFCWNKNMTFCWGFISSTHTDTKWLVQYFGDERSWKFLNSCVVQGCPIPHNTPHTSARMDKPWIAPKPEPTLEFLSWTPQKLTCLFRIRHGSNPICFYCFTRTECFLLFNTQFCFVCFIKNHLLSIQRKLKKCKKKKIDHWLKWHLVITCKNINTLLHTMYVYMTLKQWVESENLSQNMFWQQVGKKIKNPLAFLNLEPIRGLVYF